MAKRRKGALMSLVVMLAAAMFIASATSAFVAFNVYTESRRRRQASKSLTVIACTVLAILFAFGALWAMLVKPG
jgi:hypothetical protein